MDHQTIALLSSPQHSSFNQNMKTALLVGGTAATGVAISAQLQDLGFDVTIYHRGDHEVDEISHLEHIHGDPHDPLSIKRDLESRSWDVTVATYGRIRHIVKALQGRTGHFVSISGIPVVAPGTGVPMTESHAYEAPDDAPAGLHGLIPRIIETEQAVLDSNFTGGMVSTVVRYPYVYGPYSIVPMEWHVIRRVLDKRKRWALQGAGLAISGRCAAPNAARLVGLIVEQPLVAAGQIYHAADTRQYTQREWIEMVAAVMDYQFEFVDIPASISPLGYSAVPMAGEYTWTRGPDTKAGIQRHILVSNEKARIDLGYQDAIHPVECIRQTVRYWLDHPPLVDGLNGRFSPSEFDYSAEDALLAFWDEVSLRAHPVGVPLLKLHPYDHPSKGKSMPVS